MLTLIVENQAHRTFAHFGGNLFVVLPMMLHPAQELEPPANPERFKARSGKRWIGRIDLA